MMMNKCTLFLSTLLAAAVSSAEVSIDSGKLPNKITYDGTRRRLSKTGKGGKSGGEDIEDGSWWSGSDDGWHPSGDSELEKLLHGRFAGKDDASGAQERVDDSFGVEGPVTTDMKSQVRWGFDEGFTKMGFEISILNGDQVILIHLHCAKAGSNGPVVVDFWKDMNGADFNGVALDGYRSNDDILSGDLDDGMCGDIKLNNLASLYQAMLNGDIYLNIHTKTNRAGENRGQIFTH